jgi:cytochrome c biogenesis protein ResB
LNAEKAATTKNETNKTTHSNRAGSSILIPAIMAVALLVLDIILSVSYYRNQNVYDLRWVLALLDVSILLCIYAVLGKRVSHFLVSMKLALTLLFVLAILSIIGTILPQGDDVLNSSWVNNPLYDFYRHLGLFEMYHSRWFLAILFLLTFNLVMCIYHRLPTAIKHTFRPRVDVKDIFITSQPLSAELKDAGDRGRTMAKEILSHHRYHVRAGKTGSLMAEKGRFSGLFSLAFHLSFLLIGLGAIIISFAGFDHRMEIPDGATAQVPDTNLQVTNHGFTVETEPIYDGDRIVGYRPSTYSSDLELYDNGESVARKTILVNDPLRYKGVNFHQSSYYRTGRGYVTVLSVNKAPGKSLVYVGFGAAMGGIIFGLYFPHRRIWFKTGDSGELLIGGRTNRSKVSFKHDFDRIVTELRMRLGQEASSDGRIS